MKYNIRDEKGRFVKQEEVNKEKTEWIGYKGFLNDFSCLGKKYKVGDTYKERGHRMCAKGMMHYCEAPIDVFAYYGPTTNALHIDVGMPGESKYALVSSKVEPKEIKGDLYSKRSTNNLYIQKELSLRDLIKEQYKYKFNNIKESECATSDVSIFSKANKKVKAYRPDSIVITEGRDCVIELYEMGQIGMSKGRCSYIKSNNIGNISIATNTSSVAHTKDNYSIAFTTEPYSASYTEELSSLALSRKNRSLSYSKGSHSISLCLGTTSLATSSGIYSTSITTRAFSMAKTEAKKSVAIVTGGDSHSKVSGESSIAIAAKPTSCASTEHPNSAAFAFDDASKAKGVLNSILVFGVYKDRKLIDIVSFKVDGKKVKENTWYYLYKGKLEEYK